LTKVNIHESDESKIARFVSRLRREIQDVVELYEYTSLRKLIHLAIKFESQILKKNSFKKILIMMTFTNNFGRIKINFKTKLLLPIFQENPLHNIEFLKTPLLLLLLNLLPKPQIESVSNV